MIKYTVEKFEDYGHSDTGWHPDKNPVIVETAGFVPLEVKFKRFEEAGIRAQFSESEFTSSDLRDIYLHPDFSLNQYDDLEEIERKEAARQAYIEQLLASRQSVDKPGAETAERKAGDEPAAQQNSAQELSTSNQ